MVLFGACVCAPVSLSVNRDSAAPDCRVAERTTRVDLCAALDPAALAAEILTPFVSILHLVPSGRVAQLFPFLLF